MGSFFILVGVVYAVALVIQAICGAKALSEAKGAVKEEVAHADLMSPQNA